MSFYWTVSSEQGGDYLQFYIDSTFKDQVSGEVDWQQKSYSVDASTHILKWRGACPASGTLFDGLTDQKLQRLFRRRSRLDGLFARPGPG